LNLTAISQLKLYPRSLVSHEVAQYGLAEFGDGPRLAVLTASADAPLLQHFAGKRTHHDDHILLLGPLNARNALVLREQLPWLRPRPLGLRTSIGLGDTLGLATPGQVRALRAARGISAVFAQHSLRDETRTGRSPQQAMDDATWGLFQEGWRHTHGAVVEQVKTTADIDRCAVAGFTCFSIDPGDHVNYRAETAPLAHLRAAAARLSPDRQAAATGLLNQTLDLDGHTIHFDEQTLLKTMVKFAGAVTHVVELYQHLLSLFDPAQFELEVALAETEQSTTPAEHLYVASELKRWGVRWVSLAPHFVGRFEWGVDYTGSVQSFEKSLAVHAAIARRLGPYKLSLHSGSDKFSLYPAVMRQTRGLVHVSTAAPSYMEALRTVVALDPLLFRKIYTFARERYAVDRIGSCVSADVTRTPAPEDLADAQLPRLLDQFDARQVLIAACGSVLAVRNADGSYRFRDRLLSVLRAKPDAYAAQLEKCFGRYVQALMAR
jgi:hypothetical protein